MGKAFLKAYSELLIKTCHRRGAFAMGGMAAQIPDAQQSGRQRGRLRQGARRQGARGEGRPRRHLGRAPRPRSGGAGDLRPADAAARTSSTSCATDVKAGQKDLLEVHDGTRTEAGPPREHPRRRAVHRGVAARPRRRAALQPDGGRGDRRDQPLADLAAAPFPGDARGRPEGHDGALREVPRRGDGAGEGRDRREDYAKGRFPEAIELFRDALDRRDALEPS